MAQLTASELKMAVDGGSAPIFLVPIKDGEYDAPLLIQRVLLPRPDNPSTVVLCERQGWGEIGISWECVVEEFEVVGG